MPFSVVRAVATSSFLSQVFSISCLNMWRHIRITDNQLIAAKLEVYSITKLQANRPLLQLKFPFSLSTIRTAKGKWYMRQLRKYQTLWLLLKNCYLQAYVDRMRNLRLNTSILFVHTAKNDTADQTQFVQVTCTVYVLSKLTIITHVRQLCSIRWRPRGLWHTGEIRTPSYFKPYFCIAIQLKTQNRTNWKRGNILNLHDGK